MTVTFDAAVPYPDVRIAEYSGIDLFNAFDVAISGTGTGATSNSGSVTTTNANDLLVGANYVTTHTTGAGSGFTPAGDHRSERFDPGGSGGDGDAVATALRRRSPMAAGSCRWWRSARRARVHRYPSTDGAHQSCCQCRFEHADQPELDGLHRQRRRDGLSDRALPRVRVVRTSRCSRPSTTTTYNNTGLAASTSYSYRVRATDAAGNLSGLLERIERHHARRYRIRRHRVHRRTWRRAGSRPMRSI